MAKRKSKSLLFLCFLLSLFLIEKANAHLVEVDLPLLQKVIFIDPGHGGRDPGTMEQDILEKDLNLEIAVALQEELIQKGAIVYLTRTSDVDYSNESDNRKKRADLSRRIQMIEKENSDLYLSIHINWYEESYRKGPEVLYADTNPNNKILGEAIMKHFQQDLKSTRHLAITDLYLYNNIKIPGVLIECGFLSNPNEQSLLKQPSYQKQLSKAITQGVIDYLKQSDAT